MKIFKFFFLSLSLLLFGCSASEITEETETSKQEVTYKTEEITSEKKETTQRTETVGVSQESQVAEQTTPEYIPQGPPTPPPPPVKVKLGSETQTSEEQQTPPPATTELYQYKVQVFAFRSKLNAESEAQKIRNRMPDQKVYVEFQDGLYKVRLGIYSKWEHAKGIKDALYNLGYTDSFIITESKQ